MSLKIWSLIFFMHDTEWPWNLILCNGWTCAKIHPVSIFHAVCSKSYNHQKKFPSEEISRYAMHSTVCVWYVLQSLLTCVLLHPGVCLQGIIHPVITLLIWSDHCFTLSPYRFCQNTSQSCDFDCYNNGSEVPLNQRMYTLDFAGGGAVHLVGKASTAIRVGQSETLSSRGRCVWTTGHSLLWS